MRVNIQGPLVNTGRQCRIQALRQPLSHHQLARDLLELLVRLQRLMVGYNMVSGVYRKRHTFSNDFRNDMKSAHSCTLSNELRHRSTCWVYFLNLGSDAYAGGVDTFLTYS